MGSKKAEGNKTRNFKKAAKDFRKIQAEIAPFIKKQKRIEESDKNEWQKTSIFLLRS